MSRAERAVASKHIVITQSSSQEIEREGVYLLGSMVDGTYCLPSCHKRQAALRSSLTMFPSETMAKAAGLRACKQCRPDRTHAHVGNGLREFEELVHLMETAPMSVPSVSALAEHVALTMEGLEVLLADHAHIPATEWLERMRVQAMARRLLDAGTVEGSAASSAGFVNADDGDQAFFRRMYMTPTEYQALGQGQGFRIALPEDYRAVEILAYHGRDADGLSERTEGNRIFKALATPDGPAVMKITLHKTFADVAASGPHKLGVTSFANLHRAALNALGLRGDVRHFEARHPELSRDRRGLRLPLIPSAFDALCWAIIGQQINLSFAGSLRHSLILLAGEPVEDMRVHPTPAAVAALDPFELTSRRFSRSKANYLISVARAIDEGKLPIEELINGSALAAEALLTAQYGVGTWTARYVMMRTGFADAAPIGDSGLATALERMHALPLRPNAVATARLMARYAPWRSLASAHLWATLL